MIMSLVKMNLPLVQTEGTALLCFVLLKMYPKLSNEGGTLWAVCLDNVQSFAIFFKRPSLNTAFDMGKITYWP